MGRLSIWDWRQQAVIETIGVAFAQDVAVDPGGARFATGLTGSDQPMIWDSVADRVYRLEGGPEGVGEVAFSPDGAWLAAAYPDGVRLFDPSTGRLLLHLRASDPGYAIRLAFSPDGRYLAAHTSGMIRVWAVDPDLLAEIGRQDVTRSLTDDECRQFLHFDRCPAP